VAFLSTKLPWELAQTKWASTLNPILALPILSGNLVQNIDLVASRPLAVNHLLDRMPQGWFLVDNTANAAVWRAKPFNIYAVTLEASADTTISIWVF
jgi:hypothetical protein